MASLPNLPSTSLSSLSLCRVVLRCSTFLSTSAAVQDDKEEGNHKGVGNRRGRPRMRKRVAHTWYKPDEVNVSDPWSSVWQGPRTFNPYMVPFPVFMGRPLKGKSSPPPIGNLELMKIPNFLHLTPPAIEKHCKALKSLCTPWPKTLPFMPLKVETRNYVFPGHSVKHPGSKRVVIRFKLSDLWLGKYARNKMIELLGSRYIKETDTVTIHAERCPTRAQNLDYAMYLLKVLYLESSKVEPWEVERTSAE